MAHLSDLHFGAVDARVAAGLRDDLLRLVDDGGIDALVVSGDLTQRARAGQFAQATAYLQELAGGSRPVIVTPGNHDVPLWNLYRRLTGPLEGYQSAVDEWGLLECRLGDVAFATACSARRCSWRPRGFWKDGLLDHGRLQHAVNALGHCDARWRVLVTHHPLAVAEGLSAAEVVHGWPAVAPLIENAGIRVILGGHLHTPYVAEITLPGGSKATYVAAGTAISIRLRHIPNSYNLLEFGEELRVERRDWTGQRFVQVG